MKLKNLILALLRQAIKYKVCKVEINKHSICVDWAFDLLPYQIYMVFYLSKQLVKSPDIMHTLRLVVSFNFQAFLVYWFSKILIYSALIF